MSGFGGMGLPPVVAHLMGDISHFAAKMGEADAIMAGTTGAGAAKWATMGKTAMAAGGIMAAGAGIVAEKTMEAAAHFNAEMELVHTQAGASQKEVDSLKSKVEALASATGVGPDALAEGLYHVESVGYRGAAAMATLTEAAKLSMISGASMEDVTYGLTSVMNSFGASSKDAAKYAALFNGVVGIGDMRMQDFAHAVGTGFFSTGQTFKMSAQSMGAALAFLTDRGMRADEASTRLRMSIALMAAPSAKSTKILQSLGLTANEVAVSHKKVDGILAKSHITFSTLASDLQKPDGFYVALQHLKQGLEDSGMSAEAANAQLSHAFGGGRSDAAILAMLNNLPILKSKYDALGASMGRYGESAKAAAAQPVNQWKMFTATLHDVSIEIGNQLLPYGLKMLGWLKTGAAWVAAHSGVIKALAIIIGVTLVTGIGLAIAGFIAFAAATVEVWGPILLIVLAVEAVVAIVIYLWTHWHEVWGWIVDHARKVGAWLGGIWDSIKAKVREVWQGILDWIKAKWQAIASWLSQAWHTVTDPIVKAWNWVHDTTVRVWDAISAFFKKWWPLLFVIFFPVLALLVAIWNHTHQAVHDFFVNTWNKIKQVASTVWNAIRDSAKFVWLLIEQHVVHPIQRAWHALTDLIGRIHDRLVRGFQRILAYVRAGWNVFYSIAIKPVVDFVKAVGDWMDRFGKAVNKAFDGALAWVRKHLSDWAAIGRDIVNGVVNAITGAAGWAGRKVSGFFNGLLQGAKSFLGISSPSKLFADEVGKWIPRGVAVGVTAHTGSAESSVAAMGRKLRAVAEVAVRPVGGAGRRSEERFATSGAVRAQLQPIIVHLTSTANVDGRTLFETQQKHALQYQKRNARPAFAH